MIFRQKTERLDGDRIFEQNGNCLHWVRNKRLPETSIQLLHQRSALLLDLLVFL